MNHQQHTAREQDRMAAATAAYRDQMGGGNMAMAMDQFGAQNSGIYAGAGDSTFYPIEQGNFDAQNPPPLDPNQPPLLNNGENDFLQSFFEDPNHLLNPFVFSARPDEKPVPNGNTVYGASVFDPATGTIGPSASTDGPSHHSHRKAHASSSASQANFAGGQQDLLSADDYRAAQTIGTLKTSPSASDYASPSSQFAGSWGNFTMAPQPMGNMGMEMAGFAGAFNNQNSNMHVANSARNSHGHSQHSQHSQQQQQQHSAQASNIHQQHFYAQPQPAPPPQPPARNQSVDTASQHARRHQPSHTTASFPDSRSTPNQVHPAHAGSRPAIVQWGSDPNFGEGSGFSAPSAPPQHNKSGNLLNIFGAQDAISAMSIRKSGARGSSIKSPTSAQEAAAWGTMHTPNYGGGDQSQPRKRRKSQADREQEAEWTQGQQKQLSRIKTEDSEDESFVEAAGGAIKRRKSAYTRQSIDSPAAEEDDGEDPASPFRKKRGTKKPRETLSEAQKRDNHIKSEKKRREIITTGYSDLNTLVPVLSTGKSGLSRSECLQEVAGYLLSLVDGTTKVMTRLGITDSDWDNYKNTSAGQQLLRDNGVL